MNPLLPEPVMTPGRNASLGATGAKGAKPETKVDSEDSTRFRDTMKANVSEQQKPSKSKNSVERPQDRGGQGETQTPKGRGDQVSAKATSRANTKSEAESQASPESTADVAPVEGQVTVPANVSATGTSLTDAASVIAPLRSENAGPAISSAQGEAGEHSIQLARENSDAVRAGLSVSPTAEAVTGLSTAGMAPGDEGSLTSPLTGNGRQIDATTVVKVGTGNTDTTGKPGGGILQNELAKAIAASGANDTDLGNKVATEKPAVAVTTANAALSFQAAYTKSNLDWQFANRTQTLESGVSLEIPGLSGTSGSAQATGSGYAAMSAVAPMQVNEAAVDHRVQMPVNIKFGQPEWAGMVAERTAMMASQKISFAELQLDPPELGPLQVKVTVQHDQASVNFVSASPAVRDSLEQTAVRLREMLDQQGVDLVDVNVADHSDQQRQESGESGGSSNGKLKAAENDVPGESGVNLVTVVPSGIDHYV